MRVLISCATVLMAVALYAQETIANTDYNNAVIAFNKGKEYYDYEDYDRSVGYFREAIRLNPNNADYPYVLSQAYYELKQFDSARFFIEKAISLEANQPDYHYRAGNVYYHLKEYEKAYGNYSIALDHLNIEYPINEVLCHFNRGICAINLKRYSQSLQDFDFVISQDPEFGEAIQMKGLALIRLKKKEEACKCFKEAQQKEVRGASTYLSKYCD